jgi:hypothetical protein
MPPSSAVSSFLDLRSKHVWNLLAILAIAAVTTGDSTATRLDGSTVTGQLQRWQDERLTLDTATGPVEIAEAELLSLELSPATPATAGQPFVELIDGSLLPIAEYGATSKQATVHFAAPNSGASQESSLPLAQVHAVQLQPLDAEVVPQWQEIRALESPSDVLVVLKREGKSLDYLEGVVEEVTPTDVAFKLDGDTVRVPRGKVAGVVYYRAKPAEEDAPRCVLTGDEGLRLVATSVRLEDSKALISTGAGFELLWPLAALDAADFSAGKLAYLSDLEPVSQKWQPLVALPAATKYAARYGEPRLDRSAVGGPLTLAFPDADRPDAVGKLQEFAKGLALRSRTEYIVRLPSGYSRFLATAGIEPTMQSSGNVMLAIYGDDRVLMEAPIAGDAAPLAIELDVAGVKRLRIVVDYGQNLDTGDWLNLCSARIVK